MNNVVLRDLNQYSGLFLYPKINTNKSQKTQS